MGIKLGMGGAASRACGNLQSEVQRRSRWDGSFAACAADSQVTMVEAIVGYSTLWAGSAWNPGAVIGTIKSRGKQRKTTDM